MGKIVKLSDIRDQADFYFEDAYYYWEKKTFVFKWPSNNYPFCAHIHNNNINNKIKIEVRKWVDRTIPDVVIYDTVDLSYRARYAPNFDWDNSYDVPNLWHRFSFSDEKAHLCFMIAFSDVIKPISAHNPDYPYHEEVCKMTPLEREEYYEKARNSKKN